MRVAVVLTLIAAVALLIALALFGLNVNTDRSTTGAAVLPPRIAIVDGAGTLETMDVLGGSVVRHPVEGVTFHFPAWSPDGSRVAAIGSSTGGDGVYVFQARDGASDPVTAADPTVVYRSADQPPFYLYWAPDSSRLTFLTQEPQELAMRVAPADGSSPDSVVRHGAPLYWDWIDPAHALVNIGAGSPGGFLGEVGLDGAGDQPTATASIFRSPAMSRDGSRRAYSIGANLGSQSIVIESRDGGNRHEIPIPGLAAFSFAPGGGSLAFIAPAEPTTQPVDFPIGPLRVVDVATGSVRTLQEGSLIAFFWSPDGRTIATLRIPAPGENEVASLGLRLPPVATDTGYNLSLAFVDVATGDVRATTKVRVTYLFGLQVLPYFDQYALSHRFWSPDSSSIALPMVNDEGVDGVVVLPADGSAQRRLTNGEMGSWSP
jgi:TolB protein